MIRSRFVACGLVLGLMVASGGAPAVAQTTAGLLHAFPGDPGFPTARFIEGLDGRLYGTVTQSGPFGAGAVTAASILPDASISTSTLHVFNGSDGRWPGSGLVQAADGAFYGTTQAGGTENRGTVFRVTVAGDFAVLHSFSGPDGASPTSALVQAADGRLYGTTLLGGAGNVGTVFRISVLGDFTTVHAFTGVPDQLGSGTGAFPIGGLATAPDGNLYGTTSDRLGTSLTGNGTVYRVTPAGELQTIHRFGPRTVSGAMPQADLVLGPDGALYGTTTIGEASLFRISTGGEYSVVRLLKPAAGMPSRVIGRLEVGEDGAFYGTSVEGGAGVAGTVFKVTSAGELTVLHSFSSPGGAAPCAGLVQAGNGFFYGSTALGGAANHGTIFRIAADTTFAVLSSLASLDGERPSALIKGSDGELYGVTTRGGHTDNGLVYRVNRAGVMTVLHSFAGGADGALPLASLIQAGDGNFYGTTSRGGSRGEGTVFRVTSAGGFDTLHHFDTGGVAVSFGPEQPLAQGSDGALYGITRHPGANVFRLTLGGEISVLGVAPYTTGPFVSAADGSLYAVVTGRRNTFISIGPGAPEFSYEPGFVFRMTLDGAGTVLKMFDCFGDPAAVPPPCPDGVFPVGRLVPAPDNKLYGAARDRVFRVGLDGSFTTVAMLGTAGIAAASGGLARGSDGRFYGPATLTTGGEAIYSVSPEGALRIVYAFPSVAGRSLTGPLVEWSAGLFYGTASEGGPAGYGGIYGLSVP